jgi:thioredoxin-related protein
MKINKLLFFLSLSLNPAFLFGQENTIEQARRMFHRYRAVSYNVTAVYPNPETDEVKRLNSSYIINNYKNEKFDFYCKTDGLEQVYQKGIYAEINDVSKTIHRYKLAANQTDMIQNSRLVQYGPTFLLNHKWVYQDEVSIDGINHTHYSYLQSTRQYEGRTIKIEFNIYVSPKHTISKFERKSFVDDQLGQTVTYEFSNYRFSKKSIKYRALPTHYNLKYFEQEEVDRLQEGVQAPVFNATDLENNRLSEQVYIGNQTLLLFSATSCGASKMVHDLISDENFKLPTHFKLINVYASDSRENVEKYLKNKVVDFPIIVNQKEMEDKYQVSGFPVLYFINEKGEVSGAFEGYEEVIQFLKSKIEKK